MSAAVASKAPSEAHQHNHDVDPMINVLLATFPGLNLPRTLSIQVKASQPISQVHSAIFARLPDVDGLVLTTVSNKQLLSDDEAPIVNLLSSQHDRLLSLRLSRRLCGGKGGFGSQLRAAGGRMSSRKNRDRQDNVSGSNRNLDGRRLRTIDEAKRLAEYLAIKPEMDQREKDARKKRWEAVVEAAEKREEDIRSGKSGANQGRLDSEYVESKELAEEKTREAVLRAMKEDSMELTRTGSESSADAERGSEDDAEADSSGSGEGASRESGESQSRVSFFGWDEDDEEDEDEEEHDEALIAHESADPPAAYEGKGKGRMI